MERNNMRISTFITGKFNKTSNGLEIRTFLVIPADKNPDDILSSDVKKELGNWWKKVGQDEIITHGDKIAYGTQDATSIMQNIIKNGFATFTLDYGQLKE